MEALSSLGGATRSPWLGPAGLGLLVVATAIFGALAPFAPLEDSFGLRLWYQFRGVITPPQDVAIVALESRSSKALGVPNRPDRWPRRLHVDLVRGLTAQDASAVVLDLQFDRPREPQDDRALAMAIGESGRVLLGSYMARERQPLDAAGAITLNTDQLLQPLPELAQAAYAIAPFPLPKTPYGMRNFWLFVPSAGDEATLALRVAAMLQPDKYQALYTQATGQQASTPLSSTQLRQLRAVLPADHTFNLYGPPGTITTIPYDQALARLRDPADNTFRDKVVLVGFSEFNQPESRDTYATAYSRADGLEMSGVELMATAVANLLHEEWLQHPGALAWMAIMAGFGVALILPWLWCTTRAALLLNGAVGMLYCCVGAWLFRANVWLPLVTPLAVQLPLLSGIGLLFQHRRSINRIALLRDTLNRYLPGAEIQRLLQQHRGPNGDIEVVCLFTDIAGYTTVAETMPAQALRQWLNDYLGAVIQIITAYDGHVVDVTGDAVLALWAPQSDAQAACAWAVQAAEALQQLGSIRGTASRIGIHYGPVSFGEVGGGAHIELRAVGDTVNTASRLQGANKLLGTRVLMSAEVATQLADRLSVKALGKLQLIGKQLPVSVYTTLQTEVLAWEHVRVLENK